MIRQNSSTVIRLASIINEFEKDFKQKYKKHLLPSHLKALSTIKICRSSHSPKMLMQCENDDCTHQTLIPHSCGHRHCPHCQNHETQSWIERQLQKQLPADYFMLTFTLPAQFRTLAWYNQKLLYTTLFYCVWETLKNFCLNDKKLGGIPGVIAVLHTHSRELNFHPHIHIVMPGASIDKKNRLWKKKSDKYLFNHKALAKVFRAKMLDALTVNHLKLPMNYPKDWVVHCRCVGTGEKALLYLSRYLYRGVISEKDILSCENGKVTFRYRESKSKKYLTKTVSAVHFLWLVFQHILPRGFRRVREYGFLHPNSKKVITILQWVFRLNPNKWINKLKNRKQMVCECCGALMKVVATRLPGFTILSEQGLESPKLQPV
jgi:hypothetical protein